MAISQLGSILSQYNTSTIAVSELTGGSLPAGFSGNIWVSGQNRAGRNLLSSNTPFTIASANARLQVEIQTSILTSTGEDLRRVLISYSSDTDPNNAQQITAWERFASDQVTENSLPTQIIFSTADQFTPLSVTNSSQLPPNPLNGMILEITDDAQFYEFLAGATSGTYPSTGGYWVQSQFNGFTNITSTTAIGGCDVPLRSIGSSYLAPPLKQASADSIPVKYLYLNGRVEGAGTILPKGRTRLNVLITNNGQNVTDRMGGLVVFRLLGYYRYLTATLDTSMAMADDLWYPSNPPRLPQDLSPGFAALYEVFYRFTPAEISSRVPNGNNLAFYFDDAALKGTLSANYPLTGSTIWAVGEFLRIFPGVRGSGQATIGGSGGVGYDTPFVPQEVYTGLLADTDNQYAFISGVVAGNITIRQNPSEALSNEEQRAIVSTLPGDGPPSPVSNQVTLGANGALQVTVTNDNDNVSRWNVRSDYPDAIGGIQGIATLPPRLKLFVDFNGTIYEYSQIIIVGYNQTTQVTITTLAGSIATPLPTPASDFFLYQPVGTPTLIDAGVGTLAAGDYKVYAAYTSDPSPNFLPTKIDHSTASGNIPESSSTLVELSEDLQNALNIRTTSTYIQPAVGGTVGVSVNSAQLLILNQYLQIEDGGNYRITAIADLNITLENTGATGNAPPTTPVATNRQITFSGQPGIQGPKGEKGSAAGFAYNFDASTTMADPSAGNLRLNNANPTLVTAIAISAQSAETGNPNISGFIKTWDDSTSTNKGNLQINNNGTPENFTVYQITALTDNTTWFEITVTHASSSGTLTGGIQTNFVRTGDLGNTGNRGAVGGGIKYDFSTNTTMADPGAGFIRFNNVASNLVTELALSDNSTENGNPNVRDWLITWDDSTSTNKGYVQVLKQAQQEVFAIYQINALVEETGWVRLQVSHTSSSGTFSLNDAVYASNIRTGDRGDAGPAGPQGPPGTLSAFEVWNNSALYNVPTTVTTFIPDTQVTDADPGNVFSYNNTTGEITVNKDLMFQGLAALRISNMTADAIYTGFWEYSTTGGSVWIEALTGLRSEALVAGEIGSLESPATILLNATDMVRFRVSRSLGTGTGTVAATEAVLSFMDALGGEAGPKGDRAGIKYAFDSNVTMADPGNGNVRFNNAVLGSVTQIAISKSSAETGFPDISDFINTWDDSSSSIKGYLQFVNNDTPENFAIYYLTSITNNTTWYQIAVTTPSTAGTLAGNLQLVFGRTGDKGIQGQNAGLNYIFNASTTMADPGAGNFRLNNAALGSVTAIAISGNTADAGNPSAIAYLKTWDDSTSPIKGTLQILRDSANENFGIYQVTGLTDNTTWVQLAVTATSSSGTLSGTSQLIFSRTGDVPTISVRPLLTADQTWYVSTTGSDSNDGLTPGTPFLTIQKGVDVASSVDAGIYSRTIQLADGTYTAGASLKANDGLLISIVGNPTTPANVLISGTSTLFACSSQTGNYRLRGMRLTTTAGDCVQSALGAIVSLYELDFGNATSGNHMVAFNKGRISSVGNYTVSGSAIRHIWAFGNSLADFDGARTYTFTGTPNFTVATCVLAEASVFLGFGATFTGAVTGRRYEGFTNSVFSGTGGSATYFPGSINGTLASGAQYT